MSASQEAHFHNEEAAFKYLEAIHWPHGPVCPHCGVVNHAYALKQTGKYRCAEKLCRKNFSVRIGTIFEDSPIKLHKWLFAFYLMCASKKGISSHQIHRMLGVTYKTAWFMTHRIRLAMTETGAAPLGGGGEPVEVDEAYWGNDGKQVPGQRGYKHKMKIVSLVEREGEKRSFHVANVTAATLEPIMKKNISEKARLMTDEASVYTNIGDNFAMHATVNHSEGEYAVQTRTVLVTTNTVESSFALLKRGLHGTFHHVSEAHLQRYANEFDFRWNNRIKLGVNDAQRTANALRGAEGKRLTYREVAP
jgi:transposase-like protein